MVNPRIYLSSPDVTQLEEDALVRAIRSGWIAPLGPEVDAFEEELADYCGRAHAVALSSGTAALHLALLTMGVGPGDIVLTSTLTFAATANAILYTGAEPVFVDADESGNMDPELLEFALASLAAEGRKAKMVVPVDLLGKIADHERIQIAAARFGATVISDAAESLGARHSGKSSGAFGYAAAFSFNGNKIMTTSGGGALLVDNRDFADHVRYLATQARQPAVHYEHTDVGYNYRLSNLLAAMGRAQLSRLDEMIEVRRQHRLRYLEIFDNVPGVRVFGEPSGAAHPTCASRDNFWLTSIIVDPVRAGFTAAQLQEHLAAANIEARPMWKPMHLQPLHAGRRAYLNGTSERLFETGISLPSGSALSSADIERIGEAIGQFLHARALVVR